MKRSAWLSLPVILGLYVALALPQAGRPTMPTPPPSLDTEHPEPPPTVTSSRRVDLGQLQKEADDLARAAQTIPSDVANVRKGMLPKDTIQKLKQIEKLSKHLRGQLNP
jgi:hypothetical protein